ncbi:MAG: HEAT repeat domain-containing protein [bacterium]
MRKNRTFIKQKTREIQALVNLWDPANLLSPETPEDEYDCMTHQLVSLLHKRADFDNLFKFILSNLEDHFGISRSGMTPEAQRKFEAHIKEFVFSIQNCFYCYPLPPRPPRRSRIYDMDIPYEADLTLLHSMLSENRKKHHMACLILANKGDAESLKLLIEQTDSPDSDRRLTAIEAIGRHPLGAEAANLLIKMLRDKSPSVVQQACQTLTYMKIIEAHEDIMPLLELKESYIRYVAVQALNVFWEESDFEILVKICKKDSSLDVRKEAAFSLCNHADRHNWKALVELWHSDENPRQRVWACKLIERYGDTTNHPILEELSRDQNYHVRWAAKKALKCRWISGSTVIS